MPYPDLLAVAVRAAEAGASELRPRFRSLELEVRSKAKNDLVTSADKASEGAVLEVIRDAFPDHAILAEEDGHSNPGGHLQWVVDPLDGTNNFLQGLPTFCVSVACLEHGRPVVGVVLDPIHEECFQATRGGGAFRGGQRLSVSDRDGLDGAFLATGYPFRAHRTLDLYLRVFREIFLEARAIRRCGSAALDLSYTAAGIYDGFFEFRLGPWDIAAGILLVEEAGGRVSDLDGGNGYFDQGNVLAGGSETWKRLREIVGAHVGERAIRELESEEAVALR